MTTSVQTNIKYGFGPHLMVDCYGCAQEKLADVNFVLDILEDLPQKIGAKKVSSPQVFKFNGDSSEESGVSGVIMVNKSHISVHTFPDKKHAFIDVFSSQEFDMDYMQQELLRLFGANRNEVKVVNYKSEGCMPAVGQLAQQPRAYN